MLEPLGWAPVAAAAFTLVAHHDGAPSRPKAATPAGSPGTVVVAPPGRGMVAATMLSVVQLSYTLAVGGWPATGSSTPRSPWWKGKMQGSLEPELDQVQEGLTTLTGFEGRVPTVLATVKPVKILTARAEGGRVSSHSV